VAHPTTPDYGDRPANGLPLGELIEAALAAPKLEVAGPILDIAAAFSRQGGAGLGAAKLRDGVSPQPTGTKHTRTYNRCAAAADRSLAGGAPSINDAEREGRKTSLCRARCWAGDRGEHGPLLSEVTAGLGSGKPARVAMLPDGLAQPLPKLSRTGHAVSHWCGFRPPLLPSGPVFAALSSLSYRSTPM